MVLIPVEDGKPYCIDERETVYGEYKQFVEAKGDDFSGQPPECEWNRDFKPVEEISSAYPDIPPAKCSPPLDEANPDHAVRCVDFCDAWAYCSWAGKRLCGLRGAEPGKIAVVERDTGPESEAIQKSEWMYVCTQGGTSEYPYGDEHVPGICIDKAKRDAEGDSALVVRDTAGNECCGTRPPYDQVHNMSGGTRQWVNISAEPGYSAAVQGGQNGETARSCGEGFGFIPLVAMFGRPGLRCCAGAVQAIVDGL